MSERQYHGKESEKAEKDEEKSQEKAAEKVGAEKIGAEKWQRDPLSAVVWAAILIWTGVVLLWANLAPFDVEHADWFASVGIMTPWAIVLIGAGGIVLLEVVIRLLVPAYRRAVGGSLIFAGILLAVGLGLLGENIARFWPVIPIIIGLAIILGGLFWRRRQ